MVTDRTKTHVCGLTDSDLTQYVLTGERLYAPDAIAFARAELQRRHLTPEAAAALRRPIVDHLVRTDAANPTLLKPIATSAIVCQHCGVEAPCRYVEYSEHVGAIAVRFTKYYRGHFCKRCCTRLFWKTGLITLFLGWWGLISFFASPAGLITNVLNYVRTFSLARVPSGASQPFLPESEIPKLEPFAELIGLRLVEAIDPSDIAHEVASLAGVTPGHAWCYVQSVIASKLVDNQRPTFGFPVVMKSTED